MVDHATADRAPAPQAAPQAVAATETTVAAQAQSAEMTGSPPPPPGATVQQSAALQELSDTQIQEALKKNRAIFRSEANLNRGLIFAARDFLRLTVINEVDEALVRAIADWQTDEGLAVDGVLNATTLPAMEEQGLASRNPDYWAERDLEAIIHLHSAEDEARLEAEAARAQKDVSGVRQAIVNLAASQIGMVNSADRGDGHKYGGERISRFYAVALGENDVYVDHPGTRGANTLPGGKKAGDKVGHWSWCGIFAVWAVKSATGVGAWGKSQEVGYTAMKKSTFFDPDLGAKPGDIVRFAELSHRAIVKEVRPASNEVVTIDGNQVYQNVQERVHKADEIVDWLQTVAP